LKYILHWPNFNFNFSATSLSKLEACRMHVEEYTREATEELIPPVGSVWER